MKGIIFDIQKFSIHDGPGIRTTVFFKGCPLRCIWCNNPESQKGASQIAFKKENCTNCMACSTVCKNSVHHFDETGKHIVNFKACQESRKCIESCSFDAMRLIGRETTVEEVMAEVGKDREYYANSGGGITLSGG